MNFIKALWQRWFSPKNPLLVNDTQSKLNPTKVAAIHRPQSIDDLVSIVKMGEPIAISGGRHAMGGQQFLEGKTLIDMRSLNRILKLDPVNGIAEIEAGINWPTLVSELHALQPNDNQPWTIANKQTGADYLTLGGAISANAHGRSLDRPPLSSDVESFVLIDAHGEVKHCSRTENPELFSLVTGGYGLFGLIYSIQFRLIRRCKIERVVEVIPINQLIAKFDERLRDGYKTGDFQYVTDEKSDDFLVKGVYSCYRPISCDREIPDNQDSISERQWKELVYMAHTDKSRAFKLYSEFYSKTTGQIYWSDTSQIGSFPEDYHLSIDRRMKASCPGSEVITEIYVPRHRLEDFMKAAAVELRSRKANVIYGTIRLIEEDTDSFLRWAKEPYACIIFNLHVDHEPAHIEQSADAFRCLIDLGIERGGSYYLTYHKWASKEQVLHCYPQFPEFLQKKLEYDPNEIFQSTWYQHYKQLLG